MQLAGSRGFRRTDGQQPWSYDSKALAFVTWDDDPLHIYDIREKSLRQVSCALGFVHSVQWNPVEDRLLVTSATGAALTDTGGNRRGTAAWTIGSFELPHCHWMKDGNWFFMVARESGRPKTTVTFYAGDDAAVGETHELDPLDLVPYDADEFRDLAREGLCLVIGPSTGSVAQLLDMWHRAEFDQPSGTLYLSVYRPVSAVFRDGTQPLCKVEERWVAVELTP
jgi:hypothetical protein